jgi:hypothetical protein
MRKNKSFPLKSLLLIQCSTGILSQRNKTGERNKNNLKKEGRSQIIPISR